MLRVMKAGTGDPFMVGRDGAGKTTAMRIVLGVLAADAGEVTFAGTALTFEADGGIHGALRVPLEL